MRCGGHHVAVLEGRGVLSRGQEARDVGDVAHQNGAHLIGDLLKASEVPPPSQDHGGAEDQGGLPGLLEVDQTGLQVHTVGQAMINVPFLLNAINPRQTGFLFEGEAARSQTKLVRK